MKTKTKNNPANQPMLLLIQDIKDGRFSPKLLAKDLRLEIVEFLVLQGQDSASIAQFLQITDRTIRRDLVEIRQKNEVSLNPGLVKVVVGEMLSLCRQHISHLMRLARSREGSLGEKANAEYLAHRVYTEVVQRLQSLAYLPTQPQTFAGSFYHNLEGPNIDKAFGDLKKEILEVDEIVEVCSDVDPDDKKQLDEAKKLMQGIKTLKTEGGDNEKLK